MIVRRLSLSSFNYHPRRAEDHRKNPKTLLRDVEVDGPTVVVETAGVTVAVAAVSELGGRNVRERVGEATGEEGRGRDAKRVHGGGEGGKLGAGLVSTDGSSGKEGVGGPEGDDRRGGVGGDVEVGKEGRKEDAGGGEST